MYEQWHKEAVTVLILFILTHPQINGRLHWENFFITVKKNIFKMRLFYIYFQQVRIVLSIANLG